MFGASKWSLPEVSRPGHTKPSETVWLSLKESGQLSLVLRWYWHYSAIYAAVPLIESVNRWWRQFERVLPDWLFSQVNQ